MKKKMDISSRADIEKLVRVFYEKILSDQLLAPIFLEVAKIDLNEHLPVLFDFWESVLFQAGKYQGNPMEVHLNLHLKHRLEEIHFNQWLKIFSETVDTLYEGDNANQIKLKAISIASIMKMKIDNLEKMRLEINN